MGVATFVLIFSGCTQKKAEREGLPNPYDPDYIPGVMNTKKDVEKKIDNITDKRNQEIQNEMKSDGTEGVEK